jgi:hypothetical protein
MGGVVIGSCKTGLLLLVLIVLPVCLGGCLFDSGDDGDSGSYEINGYVLTESGAAIRGVEIKAYFDKGDGPPSTPSTITVTDSRGYYRVRFNASVEWLRVTPSKALCDFSPLNISYNPTGRSIPNENFTGYCGSFNQIEGHVRTPEGGPVRGVAVLVREAGNVWNTTVFTDSEGFYIISGMVPGHTYVVKPTFAGYTFDPSQRNYPNLAQDFTGQDFAANTLP